MKHRTSGNTHSDFLIPDQEAEQKQRLDAAMAAAREEDARRQQEEEEEMWHEGKERMQEDASMHINICQESLVFSPFFCVANSVKFCCLR